MIMTSVPTLMEELEYQIAGVSMQVPFSVISHAFEIGWHAKIVGKIVPMAAPIQMNMIIQAAMRKFRLGNIRMYKKSIDSLAKQTAALYKIWLARKYY